MVLTRRRKIRLFQRFFRKNMSNLMDNTVCRTVTSTLVLFAIPPRFVANNSKLCCYSPADTARDYYIQYRNRFGNEIQHHCKSPITEG